ncbi:MAG: 4-hydroxy-3-methylbut-2-enyl diphosphate reductase [Thermoanaerobaculaceae bacterium]|jgi:4-hydroxy-3-methylbut-2-enyl diphosphate reductase|nr:4-hydroxy-3-methylbut-2-enyl diphosphate reductase [Thermoanaerobaculaceae bacterium]
MSVIVSRTAGFCMGVRRAMEKALEERSRTPDTLFTLGPLIHNPHVLDILRRNRVLEVSEESAEAGSRVIIRAHGVAPPVRRKLAERSCIVIDATCPKVARVQKMALRAGEAGRQVVIAGDKDHAEVRGILGHALAGGVCISTVEEARSLELDSPALLVAQTTFSEESFAEIAGALRGRHLDIEVQDTICDATSERQEEARRMALEMDAIVIVGGRTSANTRRLAEIITGLGTPAFLVEDEGEIPPEVSRYETIGVTAGASTPNWLISRVAERLVEMQARGVRWLLWRCLAFLVRSNLLVALSALALTLLSVLWQRLQPGFRVLAVPPLYLFGIHLLNTFSESQAQEINEPAQKMFMQQNRAWLMPLAWMSLGIALLLASLGSLWAGVLTASAIILGLLYQVRIPFARVQLIRIPGSKDLFTAGAWAVFTCCIPALIAEGRLLPSAFMASAIVFSITMVRALAYDLKDLQGDRMVGKETIPIYLGMRWSSVLSTSLIVLAAGLATVALALGVFPPAGALALLLPAHALVYLRLFQSRRVSGAVLFSATVDGFFPILGLLALAFLP